MELALGGRTTKKGPLRAATTLISSQPFR